VPEAPGALAVFINKMIAALLPKLGVLQLDASEVSRDPAVVQRYRADPLVHSGKIRRDWWWSCLRDEPRSRPAAHQLRCRCWSCTARAM
jgi:alpha-beta hydrolase superfamily lysophospholipase